MRFFILGVQPGTTSVITLNKVFDTLEQATQHMKSLSAAWGPFNPCVAAEVEAVEDGPINWPTINL